MTHSKLTFCRNFRLQRLKVKLLWLQPPNSKSQWNNQKVRSLSTFLRNLKQPPELQKTLSNSSRVSNLTWLPPQDPSNPSLQLKFPSIKVPSPVQLTRQWQARHLQAPLPPKKAKNNKDARRETSLNSRSKTLRPTRS